MRKIEKRAAFCLLLAGALLLGLLVFCFRFVTQGREWVSFPSNRHLYNKQGILISGQILDRNGIVLSTPTESGRAYADSKTIRKATLHAIGDTAGNIGTGAQTVFADKMTGYNFITGAFTLLGQGKNLYLTLDAEVCAAAYEALDGKRGTVGVYNYQTGEIVCMVSTPTFDPANPPSYETVTASESYNGVYVNRFLSAAFTPGSVFKTVTLAAALDTDSSLMQREFTCTGELTIDGTKITCPSVHGKQSIQDALANSCNCVFGQLAVEVGADTMLSYTTKAGLLKSISISGIQSAKGSAEFPKDNDGNLAWAGIGQHNDLITPVNFMVYMGAIANGGVPIYPQLVQKTTTNGGIPTSIYLKKRGRSMLDSNTANHISDMMRGDVTQNYGEERFPNMELCAKSGTAEVGSDKKPHAWFAGFCRNSQYPYAFVVMVENGGGGNRVAGNIAGTVLRKLCGE